MSQIIRKQKETFKVKVITNTLIAPGVHVIETDKTGAFSPGQVVAVTMHPKENLRLYSLASSPSHPYFRILFDIKPQGELTPVLSQLKPGDDLFVSKPFGRFTDQGGEACWIATGTGIAPFVSMMEAGESANKTLLHGARYLHQFYFASRFRETMGERYLQFCTQEKGPGIHQGRLTHYLGQGNRINPELKYYLCGNAEMVVEVRDLLIGQGVPFDQIIAEIYF